MDKKIISNTADDIFYLSHDYSNSNLAIDFFGKAILVENGPYSCG